MKRSENNTPGRVSSDAVSDPPAASHQPPSDLEVLYVTSTNTATIRQTTVDCRPPLGFEGGLCLLPIVSPQRLELTPTPWLVDGWLRAEGTAILSGRYKNQKSYVARQLALSIASGRAFLGVHEVVSEARGKPVVLFCAEERYEDVRRNFHRAALGLGIPLDGLPLRVIPALGMSLFDKERSGASVKPTEAYLALVRACAAVNPSLVVIDTLVAVKGNANENAADDIRPVFTALRDLGARSGAAVLVVDHEGFDNSDNLGYSAARRRPRGSSDKIGAVDSAISLSSEEAGEGRFHLSARLIHRSAGASEENFTSVFVPGERGPVYFFAEGAAPTAVTLGDEGRRLLGVLSQGAGASKRKLQEALALASPTALEKLLARNAALVAIQPTAAGKPAAVRLSTVGADLARDVLGEVLNDAGALRVAA